MHEIFSKGLNIPAPKGLDVDALAELAQPGADANNEPHYEATDVIAFHSYLQSWWNTLRNAKGAPSEALRAGLLTLLENPLALRAPAMNDINQRLRRDLEAVLPGLLGAYPLAEDAIYPDTRTGLFNTGKLGPIKRRVLIEARRGGDTDQRK